MQAPQNPQDLTAQKNQIVTDWSRDLVAELRQSIGQLRLKEKGELQKSITRRVKRQFGDPSSVTIFYRYYGGFVIDGTGKGYPLAKVKGMNAAMNKREPRDWYNDNAHEAAKELADKLAVVNADAYINNIRL